jgi:hypothetical protein
MGAAWAGSIAAMIMCAGAVAGLVWRTGRRDGKVDQILENHEKTLTDHEQRLRAWRL